MFAHSPTPDAWRAPPISQRYPDSEANRFYPDKGFEKTAEEEWDTGSKPSLSA